MSQVDSPRLGSPAQPGPSGAHPGPLRAATTLMASELRLLFRRRRTWALLAALAGIPVLLATAVRLSSAQPGPGEGPPLLDRITNNGLFVGVTAIVLSVPLFLPLTVSVVAGDSIAGESNLGTLRYLLVAPAGRLRLLVTKFVVALSFCFVATLTLVLVGAAIGALLFPVGPVTLLSGSTVSVGESLLRALAVAGYAAISLTGLTAIGIFISTLTDMPVGAMAATIVVSVAVQVLGSLPQVAWLHPWLFSNYWLSLLDMLRAPIIWSGLQHNVLLQLGYVAVFGAAAYGRFVTRDVLG